MRTLPALLAALLLLASQARAQALQEAAGQVPAQDQPVATDKDPPAEEDEGEGVTISFTGAHRPARGAAGLPKVTPKEICYCRSKCKRTIFVKSSEGIAGTCFISGRWYKLCCH